MPTFGPANHRGAVFYKNKSAAQRNAWAAGNVGRNSLETEPRPGEPFHSGPCLDVAQTSDRQASLVDSAVVRPVIDHVGHLAPLAASEQEVIPCTRSEECQKIIGVHDVADGDIHVHT